MSIISASTTSTTAYKVTADTTGTLVLQTGAAPTTAMTIDGSQNVTLAGNITLNNGAADGAQLTLSSAGFSNWNIDNYSGRFRWYYNTTEYMTLDASGNLGINNTNPGTKLVVGTPASGVGVIFRSLGGSNNPGLYFTTTEATAVCDINATGSGGGNVLSFSTSGNERARIDSSGNLLVGTTSAGTDKVRFASAGGTANQLGLVSTDDNSGNGFIQFRNSATTSIGSVSRVGTTNAVVYNTTSDYRLKTVIGAVSGAKERINALNPIEYYWTDGGQQARGFLAHEFKEVYANSVTGEKDAVDGEGNPIYQSMQASTPEVMADLVAYIQEQQAIIETLTNRITALEGSK